MTHDEIEREFSETFSAKGGIDRRPEVASWHDPKNRETRAAFVKAMRGRRYGFDALLDAWVWFLEGWNMYGG